MEEESKAKAGRGNVYLPTHDDETVMNGAPGGLRTMEEYRQRSDARVLRCTQKDSGRGLEDFGDACGF
jgi:hypothetical protein